MQLLGQNKSTQHVYHRQHHPPNPSFIKVGTEGKEEGTDGAMIALESCTGGS